MTILAYKILVIDMLYNSKLIKIALTIRLIFLCIIKKEICARKQSANLLNSVRNIDNRLLHTVVTNKVHSLIDKFKYDSPINSGNIGSQNLTLASTIIVKRPSIGMKGVIFFATESDFQALAFSGRLSNVMEEYYCVVASAWSPPAYDKFIDVIGFSKDPVFVLISNWRDLEYYSNLQPFICPLPVFVCDWLKPSLFHPRPAIERDIDIVMVAGWGQYKRHWLLFKALKDMPRNLKVVLIGANNEGRTVTDVKEEAYSFGVKQDIQFLSNLPVDEVHKYQGRSKISAQLSRREGSCIAVTEALMSGTPVGMMSDAHVGSKRHINSETGVLLDSRNIGRQMNKFLDEFEQYNSRDWAEKSISYTQSITTVNTILKNYCQDSKIFWGDSLTPVYWNYFKFWYEDGYSDFGKESNDVFFDKHGIVLK